MTFNQRISLVLQAIGVDIKFFKSNPGGFFNSRDFDVTRYLKPDGVTATTSEDSEAVKEFSLSRTIKSLSADTNSTSTTRATVSDLSSISLKAGKKYHVLFIGLYQTAANTTGCSLGLTLSSGTATIRGYARGAVSATAVATELSIPLYSFSGTGSSFTTTGVSAANTPHFVKMEAIVDCSADAVMNIQFGSEVASSEARLLSGATLILNRLS